MKTLLICFLIAVVSPLTAISAPREIIIMRHSDKLNSGEAGPALSAQGMMRSIKFAFYFLEKFGEPDYIIAADDQKSNGKEIAVRSIQTVAPLANMLQIRHPEFDFPIVHPYPSDDYQSLADYLLEEDQFDNKLVLICWSHQRIAKLAAALGVTQSIPAWPKLDYDTVYILKYDETGNLIKFTELKNQFPVQLKGSWEELHRLLFAS
jgi:hypothetical protein